MSIKLAAVVVGAGLMAVDFVAAVEGLSPRWVLLIAVAAVMLALLASSGKEEDDRVSA